MRTDQPPLFLFWAKVKCVDIKKAKKNFKFSRENRNTTHWKMEILRQEPDRITTLNIIISMLMFKQVFLIWSDENTHRRHFMSGRNLHQNSFPLSHKQSFIYAIPLFWYARELKLFRPSRKLDWIFFVCVINIDFPVIFDDIQSSRKNSAENHIEQNYQFRSTCLRLNTPIGSTNNFNHMNAGHI